MGDHYSGSIDIDGPARKLDYEKEYPSEFREECKRLLRMCLVYLKEQPDTPVKGSRGLTTHKIVSQINELLNN